MAECGVNQVDGYPILIQTLKRESKNHHKKHPGIIPSWAMTFVSYHYRVSIGTCKIIHNKEQIVIVVKNIH